MSYQVIARKYRPQTFDDVVGQHLVTDTLKNAILTDRVAHGYIFSGARGVGKTTTARILAKALNCFGGPTVTPDGTCPSCLEITAGNSVDVQEIDAASNRGIDEIRELREAVRYLPARDRYKIFLIDEAHMLTTEAFNALLKTLEEPPPRSLFMLATTEPHKLPPPFNRAASILRFVCWIMGKFTIGSAPWWPMKKWTPMKAPSPRWRKRRKAACATPFRCSTR